jgi:hypothetical protein
LIDAPAPPQRQISPDGKYEWDGTAWQPVQAIPPGSAGLPAKKKGHLVRNAAIVVGLLLVGSVVGVMANAKPTATVTPVVQPTATAKPVAVATAAPVAKPAAVPPAVVTAAQANASRSAKQYLSLTPFSRAGLIRQLSSSAGDGYSLPDATYGVDAQHADWNAQAALSAKQYLKLMPFSRDGLIQQLSSSAGDGYTNAEAVYGVTAAGL